MTTIPEKCADSSVRGATGASDSFETRLTSSGERQIISASRTGGLKQVKMARYDLLPVDALRQLAEHYGRGAEKYDDNQYRKGYEFSKSYAALQRHLNQWWGGENDDKELGSSHLVAAAWHCLTLLTFMDEHPEFDDRFRTTDGWISPEDKMYKDYVAKQEASVIYREG